MYAQTDKIDRYVVLHPAVRELSAHGVVSVLAEELVVRVHELVGPVPVQGPAQPLRGPEVRGGRKDLDVAQVRTDGQEGSAWEHNLQIHIIRVAPDTDLTGYPANNFCRIPDIRLKLI